HIQKLLVSKNNHAFLRFDAPAKVDSSYKVELNLTPGKIYSLNDGIVLYKYHHKGWDERLASSNIGLVDKSNLTALDTIRALAENEKISIDVSSYIDSVGEHSFALAAASDKDSVYFYSRDKLVLDGHFEGSIEFHNSGFATLHSVWPSISYTSDASLAVNEKSDILPKEFALHDNFPNPFNPNTTIRFDLPRATDVSIVVFNVLGQKIKTIERAQMNPGYHSIIWNATNDFGSQVSAGMYFYQLRTNEFVKTKKMILLK
ncbi:MAG: T9SS type A sorting domain-containing protein, partial [Candidatus Neomarinimicrobiota bacterium]|nr:T9SS type A sorting domain-containing protein [Candidatus Neomarinimicrobiota bacterium]